MKAKTIEQFDKEHASIGPLTKDTARALVAYAVENNFAVVRLATQWQAVDYYSGNIVAVWNK